MIPNQGPNPQLPHSHINLNDPNILNYQKQQVKFLAKKKPSTNPSTTIVHSTTCSTKSLNCELKPSPTIVSTSIFDCATTITSPTIGPIASFDFPITIIG
jgi:hypothetical protein